MNHQTDFEAQVKAFAPGRTELAGNHTDHQGGRAIAAAVDFGIEASLRADEGGRARVSSPGHRLIDLDLSIHGPQAQERGNSAALVRGVIDGLGEHGVQVGGFSCSTVSSLPSGGGLSSSAAFSLAVCKGLDTLFGKGDLSPIALAKIAQKAERDYYGKPCGLLDQCACALGGIQLVDFADPEAPAPKRLSFDFEECGYAICLIDTKTSHRNATGDYAAIPRDMSRVAQFFGKDRLKDLAEDTLMGNLPAVRESLGDLPTLRALHWYHEMRLVDARAKALEHDDMHRFLELTRLSGASSAQYLQNVAAAQETDQPAMVALALADMMLNLNGACRIHGGGFGGYVQAFVPVGILDIFKLSINQLLGEDACIEVEINTKGATATWL